MSLCVSLCVVRTASWIAYTYQQAFERRSLSCRLACAVSCVAKPSTASGTAVAFFISHLPFLTNFTKAVSCLAQVLALMTANIFSLISFWSCLARAFDCVA